MKFRRFWRAVRRRATYANVMATIAVLVACTGTAAAAGYIGSPQVIDNSLRSVDVRDEGLTGKDLAGGSVRSSEILDKTILAKDLAPSLLGRIEALEAGDVTALAGLACTRGALTGAIVTDVNETTGAVTLTCDVTDQCPDPLPDYPNANVTCDSPMGPVETTCETLWVDYNNDLAADGCEISLNTNENCGQLGNLLTPPQFCVNGQTASPEVCNAVDDDRNGVTDDNVPGLDAFPNAVGMCIGGVIQITCNPGWANTNGIMADGCEEALP